MFTKKTKSNVTFQIDKDLLDRLKDTLHWLRIKNRNETLSLSEIIRVACEEFCEKYKL
jgi:hypothetical protein